MPDSITTNYGWTLPTNNADNDTWGTLLNDNFSGIDTQMFAVSGVASAAMPKAGGAFTGAVSGTSASFTGGVTAGGGFTGALSGNAASATTAAGCTGNAATATALAAAATLSFTGDATGSMSFSGASASAALTLRTVNSNTGSFGSSSAVPVLNLDASGRVLSASTAPILPGTPPGAVMAFAMAAAPQGWLVCDGSNVSRTTYAALFAAIGAVFGNGDGSTTFGLPDLRGQFVRGWADGGTLYDAGRAFGGVQADAYQDHEHAVTPYVPSGSGGGTTGSSTFQLSSTVSNTGLTLTGAGYRAGAETRPVNVALLYCIKT